MGALDWAILKTFNAATGLLKIPPIEVPEIPYIPRPPDIPTIPLSKTAQAKNEGVAMAGGGLVPGYENGGVVTDPEEKRKIVGEEFVNVFTKFSLCFKSLSWLLNALTTSGLFRKVLAASSICSPWTIWGPVRIPLINLKTFPAIGIFPAWASL